MIDEKGALKAAEDAALEATNDGKNHWEVAHAVVEAYEAARSAEPVAWRWRYDGERAWTLCKRKPALWPDAEMQPLYAHPKEAPDA